MNLCLKRLKGDFFPVDADVACLLVAGDDAEGVDFAVGDLEKACISGGWWCVYVYILYLCLRGWGVWRVFGGGSAYMFHIVKRARFDSGEGFKGCDAADVAVYAD